MVLIVARSGRGWIRKERGKKDGGLAQRGLQLIEEPLERGAEELVLLPAPRPQGAEDLGPAVAARVQERVEAQLEVQQDLPPCLGEANRGWEFPRFLEATYCFVGASRSSAEHCAPILPPPTSSARPVGATESGNTPRPSTLRSTQCCSGGLRTRSPGT